ncbi:Chromosome-associated kinesin KIF4 [Dissostichus eleginoides]|uniref:Chromosome-associated kinesin KIF4 n=1 Tax=Dissostichus eleginoides TaxID=100907 RepID=A0AAD9CTG1_DISEL|nr:Chromosome-associated kinesin KIF4 [Dissostichus eleginoides]
MEVKSKVQAPSSLRKIPKINEKKIHLDSLKLFNRLIIFAQRDMTVETSLAYELTPFPLSLFSNKDQKMNKANKAGFSKTSLKELTDLLDLTNQSCSTLVVDGGWLLYMVKWEQGQTWQEIANSYLSYVQCLGTNHPLFFTTSKGSYDVRRIREALSERERCYLLFCHAFTGCDTVSAIAGHGKTTLFDRFCAGDIDEHMDIFLDTQATKDAAAAGLIKPETLPPTEGAAAQHSLRAYLQTQDWILLQSMSLNPSDYGWTLGVHGYEPVQTLVPMAPEELLQFTSCNCNGDCSNRRCSCKRNGVKCISACGVCKGISCKNCGHDGGESGEDSEIDS